MRWSVQTKIGAGFGVAIAMLAVAGILSYLGTRDLISTLRDVAHGHAVTRTLESLLSQIKAVESDTRGYVISGSPEFLEGRRAAFLGLPAELARLEGLTGHDPAQRRSVAELRSRLAECLTWHETVVEAYRASGPTAAAALIKTGRGRQRMDSVERAIGAMRAGTTEMIQARADAHDTLLTLLATEAAACALVALALVFILRDVKRREQVENALRQSEARLSAILDNTNAVIYVRTSRAATSS